MIRIARLWLPLAALSCWPAFAAQLHPDLASLPAVPRVDLPAAALGKALAEPVKERPYQFAVPVALTLSTAQGLLELRGDTATWRLRVHSDGAHSLSLHFAHPVLPEGSALWIYDPGAHLTLGPYGADRIAPSGLWTPLVEGEDLVVEVHLPAAKVSELRLGAAQAFHGFRSWKAGGSGGGAGACNVDVTCSQASAWTADSGAVARISIGGAYLCSGQMLNNVRQDRDRLFLTANHCGIEDGSGPAASVVFYFNYTGPCDNGTSDPVPAPTFMGSQRLAHDVQSDFTLVRITDTAALPSTVYFAGWDATGAGSDSGVSMHHPGGDEMKISFYDSSLTQGAVNIGAGCPIDAWKVQWSSGTTETGSSGGGLWNAAHRLIGSLSGGAASCANPGGTDYFARFDRGWTAGTSPDRQLKAHLDPDGTCVAIVPGLDASSASPGPVAATANNRLCKGIPSDCPGGGGGGGALGLPGLLLLCALGLLRRRRL